MAAADRLLRLYPRAWRERYGEEFLDLVGDEDLRPGLLLDVLAGALDARLTRQRAVAPNAGSAGAKGGNAVLKALEASCSRPARASGRDALLGLAIMIGAMTFFLAAGSAAANAGYPLTGEFLDLFGISASFFIGLPFMTAPGQSWRFRTFSIAAPCAIIGVATLVSILT
jgi:hypothetical protein